MVGFSKVLFTALLEIVGARETKPVVLFLERPTTNLPIPVIPVPMAKAEQNETVD